MSFANEISFTGEVAFKIVESSGLKLVDALSFFAINFEFQKCFPLMLYLYGLLVIFQDQFLNMVKNNCLKIIKLLSADAVSCIRRYSAQNKNQSNREL